MFHGISVIWLLQNDDLYFDDLLLFFCTLDIQMSNESIVHLKTVTDIDFSKLVTLGDMKVAAADFDMVHQLEEILLQWYKQIEQVDKNNFLFVCYYRSNR